MAASQNSIFLWRKHSVVSNPIILGYPTGLSPIRNYPTLLGRQGRPAIYYRAGLHIGLRSVAPDAASRLPPKTKGVLSTSPRRPSFVFCFRRARIMTGGDFWRRLSRFLLEPTKADEADAPWWAKTQSASRDRPFIHDQGSPYRI